MSCLKKMFRRRHFQVSGADLNPFSFSSHILILSSNCSFNTVVLSSQCHSQKTFTKRLVGLKHVEYAERLHQQNLHSLELWRLHTNLIWCYKIVFGLVRSNFEDFFKYCPVSTTRGLPYKLYTSHCTRIHSQFFAHRIIKAWNSLPQSMNFSSLAAFK